MGAFVGAQIGTELEALIRGTLSKYAHPYSRSSAARAPHTLVRDTTVTGNANGLIAVAAALSSTKEMVYCPDRRKTAVRK